MGVNSFPMWIGGRAVATSHELVVATPFDGAEFARVYAAGAAEVNAAVEAARAAAPVMREMTLDERAVVLRKAHALLLAGKEDMARTIASEAGKPIAEARLEVDRAAGTLAFSAEEAHRLAGEVVPMDAHPAGKGHWAMTVREPLGVIAAITPFNFPLNLSMHKIGPALAAGNAVVHKPATSTPVCALKLAAIFAEAGLPAGALNVITGPGASIGDLLCTHPGVAMVTFTGSPEVGTRIRSLAGLKKVTLELGSNSAVILEADADLDDAMPRCVTGAFANSGQVCISVQRIYVHRSRVDTFVERYVEATRKLRIAHPLDDASQISSLITVREAERVETWVAEAVSRGARLLCGGARTHATLAPAVLADVAADASLSCREAFGPVVAVDAFDTLDEAIARVNASDYGLQAGIFTRDIAKAFTTARHVHVGGFLINDVPQYRLDHMPYGGVKLSGTGREGPKYAIEEMTEPKLISWRW